MPFFALRFRPRKEDLVVALATGIFSAALCFVAPTIFESGDYLLYWKPTFHFLSESVHSGVLPLWNPYVGLGRPFLADMQNAVFYPPVYLVCLGQELGVFLLVWLHCMLAVVGMRRLGHVLGAGWWQSYFMGLTYLASGALVARWVAGQITYCWGLCYVPWLLYHAVRTEERWEGWRVAQYAGCLALQFLCGHPQVFWFSTIGQAVFILASTMRMPVREAMREAGHRFRQFGVACAWCGGLVAVVLLPMLELVHQSNRTASTAVFANSYNMRWKDLLYLFVPRWLGSVWETNLLVGTVVVVTGVMGLCRPREPKVRGLLAMLVIGLLIALGDNTPLFGFFYKWVPGHSGFRFQSRAALLAVVSLICAAGIWFSRPHPRLRAVWSYLFAFPAHYGLVLLVALQIFDLLQGDWMAKQFITPECCVTLGVPFEHSVERSLIQALREHNLVGHALPPPRVCVPPGIVPLNYGMIHHYAHFDANCSLFLQRPWDYLHTMVGIKPPIEKGSLAETVYEHAPFPYRDLSLAVGKQLQEPRLVVMDNPSPRAFVVGAAQTADYETVLDRLAHGQDIRQCSLVESPLAEPLAQTNGLAAGHALIRQFEPNDLLVEVEANANALLVLAEAWYPGWKAEIDGRLTASLPANTWMRAVPVPAGQHHVRFYYQQNYLLPGCLISLGSFALLITARVKRGQAVVCPIREPEADVPAQASPGAKRPPRRGKGQRAKGGVSRYRHLARVAAAGVVLVLASLLIHAELRHVRWFLGKKAGEDAWVQFQIGSALFEQKQLAAMTPHVVEAVRLAERACRLTENQDPMQFWNLASCYAAAGHLDEAITAAESGRTLALAHGQARLVDILDGLIRKYEAARKAQAGDPK